MLSRSRLIVLILSVALLWTAGVRQQQVVAEPDPPKVRTGLVGELVAMYAPDGLPGRSFISTIDLSDLAIRSLEVVINEIEGRGDDIFVGVGVPAIIARFDGLTLEPLPGLDQEFLSTLALSPDGRTLAFARDTRVVDPQGRNEGPEVWLWDLKASRGHAALQLPVERFIATMTWLDGDTLLAQVAGRVGQHPELWEMKGSQVTRRLRSTGRMFMPLSGDKIIQIPDDRDADYNFIPVKPHVRSVSGAGRFELREGWEPLTISPDGQRVLFVSKTYELNRVEVSILGVAPIGDLRDIDVIGGVPGALTEAIWR